MMTAQLYQVAITEALDNFVLFTDSKIITPVTLGHVDTITAAKTGTILDFKKSLRTSLIRLCALS